MYRLDRDHRFGYIWDLVSHVEELQCDSCIYRSDRDEYPMCFEIEGKLLDEEPVPEFDDLGDRGVACRKYVEGVPLDLPDENQLTIF